MPTVNNQNPYARGARAAYVERQVNASNNRRHSTGSNDAQGQVNQAFDWSEITKNRKNALPRENSIRRVSSAPELPTTTVTTAETQPRNATADRLKKAGFAIASLSMITQLTGIIASIAIAALGFAVVPFIVPLIVVTIVVAFIGAAVMALGCYKASQEMQPPEGAASTQIEDANIQQAETNIDDDSDSDIGGAGASAAGNSPQPEFKLPRPTITGFPEDFTTDRKIEDYITNTSKNHYKELNRGLMGKQKVTMDAMRNVLLPTADGKTEKVNMFRYVDTYPNLDHVVCVNGNLNALISDLNSTSFPNLGYATQFPRYGLLGDFFQAIAQEKITLLNPISQPKDITQHKLFCYWLPENGGTYKATDGTTYQVESKRIREDEPDYQAGSGKNLYRLTISWTDKDGQVHKHRPHVLHIDNWQDHGAVGATELQGYVQARLDNSGKVKGKILTHCTAGVGRTGTLIAAQSMMEHPKVPLVDIVDLLRERRNYACVQSNSQAELLVALNTKLKVQRSDTMPRVPILPRASTIRRDDQTAGPSVPPRDKASSIEPQIVPTEAPRMVPILPPYAQSDSSDEVQAPPLPPRQPIVQPKQEDISAPTGLTDRRSQRLPRGVDAPKPQFDGQQATSRHQQLKAKIEAALGDHPGFNNLQLVPEGVDGRTAVKALPPGDERVLVWPSNSYSDKFAYGIMSATGEPLYYIMNNDASSGKIKLYMSQLLDR